MTQDYLNTLNDPQRRAATHKDGPLLVLAGAGSGKTYTMTIRMKHLVSYHKVDPARILGITFTNKAALELKERVLQLLGPEGQHITVSTFHSLCGKILRRDIHWLKESKKSRGEGARGYDSSFSIMDSKDSLQIIKDAMKSLEIDPETYKPAVFLSYISTFKNELMSPETVERFIHLANNPISRGFENPQPYIDPNKSLSMIRRIPELFWNMTLDIYKKYQETLVQNNSLDFDDMIFLVVRLFAENPTVLGYYQEKYKYMMIDEYQDSNHAQYIFAKLIAAKYRNLAVVGDDFQCVLPDSLVQMEEGKKRIDEVRVGDHVMTAIGRMGRSFAPINRIHKKHFKGKIYKITTESGKTMTGTPDHTAFASMDDGFPSETHCIVKDQLGYYLTSWKSKHHTQWDESGLSVWFLPDTLQDSSFEHGEYLTSIDELFESCLLFKDLPHFTTGGNHATITYFGGLRYSKNEGDHCLYLPSQREPVYDTSSMDEMNRVKMKSFVETPFMDVKEEAFLTGSTFEMMPLSHVRIGMRVPVHKTGHIVSERVRSVQILDYDGDVFDLDVKDYHNYMVDGIVTHNCIYGFRNADIRNILEFEKDYPEAVTITLDRNYRSTQQILDVANQVIDHNKNQRKKTLWTDKTQGTPVTYRVLETGKEEAEYIADEIERLSEIYPLKDFAILYRVNAASRMFEDALMRKGLSYDLVGALNFYERKEIKDIIAYLRLMDNPEDDMSLKRVINIPKRGIGDGTISKAVAYAKDRDISLWHALLEAEQFLTKTTLQKVQDFMQLMLRLREESSILGPGMMIDVILEDTGYKASLIKEATPASEDRLQNLEELLNVAWEYQQIEEEEPTLVGFLERVSLNQSTSEESSSENKDDFIRLMTIHASKGLEYKVVFVVGVEENLLPFYKAIDSGDVEEERRLCYVALTRAKEILYVTRAKERYMYNDVSFNDASRFIEEMGFKETQKQKGFVLPW